MCLCVCVCVCVWCVCVCVCCAPMRMCACGVPVRMDVCACADTCNLNCIKKSHGTHDLLIPAIKVAKDRTSNQAILH